MIHVTGNEENTVYYKCDCGTKGFCMIKPQEEDTAIIVDVKCPNCEDIERIVLLQYSSEENRERILDNLNEADFSWAPTL